MKTTTSTKSADKGTMPERDPKTGRFEKAETKPTPKPAAPKTTKTTTKPAADKKKA